MLLLTSLAPAQVFWSTEAPPTLFPGSAPFETAVAGNFRGSLMPDVVVVVGGVPMLVYQPALYRAAATIPGISGVTGAIALEQRQPGTLPAEPPVGPGLAGSSFGPPDVLLLTNAAGAWRGLYDSTSRQFAFTSVLTAAWQNASMLTAARKTGSIHTIAGRSPNNELLVAERNSVGILSHRATVPVSATIHEVKLADWDHDGALDAVVVAQDGVRAYRTDTGVEILPRMGNSINFIRSAVAVDASGFAGLASVTNAFTSPLFARILGSATTPLRMDTLPAFNLTSANQIATWVNAFNTDGIGASEVLYMRRGSYKPVFVDSAGAEEILLDETANGQPTQNLCAFLWQDLNADGVADGLFFWNSPRKMLFRSGISPRLVNNVRTFDPPVLTITAENELVKEAVYSGDPDPTITDEPDEGILALTISKANAGSATHFDLVAWHQSSPMSSPYVDNTSVDNQRIKIPDTGTTFQVRIRLRPAVMDEYFWPEKDHYYLDLRFVDVPGKRITYAETNGLTMYPRHPDPDPEPLEVVTFQYLSQLPTLPGRSSGMLPIADPVTYTWGGGTFPSTPGTPGIPGSGQQYSHTSIGEMYLRKQIPIYEEDDKAPK